MLQSVFRRHGFQCFHSEAGVKCNLVHLFTIEQRLTNKLGRWNGPSLDLGWELGELMPKSYCRGTELKPTSIIKRGRLAASGLIALITQLCQSIFHIDSSQSRKGSKLDSIIGFNGGRFGED